MAVDAAALIIAVAINRNIKDAAIVMITYATIFADPVTFAYVSSPIHTYQ